jgi:hypothetical protein
VTWRGKSAFSKFCAKRGIKQIVARPRHPQTLGKVERFWGSLWRELLSGAVFFDIHEARVRIGHWLDHYNFQRTHQALGGLVPADRYFQAVPEIRERLAARVAENARALAKEGSAKKRFYLTGRVGDESLSLHTEGDKVVFLKGDGTREEVPLEEREALVEDGEPSPLMTPSLFGRGETRELEHGALGGPGSSPLDGVLAAWKAADEADVGEDGEAGDEADVEASDEAASDEDGEESAEEVLP